MHWDPFEDGGDAHSGEEDPFEGRNKRASDMHGDLRKEVLMNYKTSKQRKCFDCKNGLKFGL